MSGIEYVEWQAFDQLEPIGARRLDVLAALICKVLVDINTPKDRPHAKLADFLLRWDPPEEQTEEQMLAQVEMWNAALAGMDKRAEDGG